MSLVEKNYRIIITGGTGFVGRHLASRLAGELPADAEIICIGRAANTDVGVAQTVDVDITDPDQVEAIIANVKPTHVAHLAAVSAVPTALRNPRHAWDVNLYGTLNLGSALMKICPDCRLLFVSSAEIYGGSFKEGRPLDETALLAPVNPYGSSKAAADLLMGQMAAEGLWVARARPFNHTGPGQSESFVVPAFAAQIARIELGLQEPVIRVGNLDAERDFLDVRDVVDAYARILLMADRLPNGLILNIASGIRRRVCSILDQLVELSRAEVTVITDETLFRKTDTPLVIGDASRARSLLGWAPQIDWTSTLAAVLDHSRQTLRSEAQ